MERERERKRKPAHYDPEGSRPHEFQALVGTQEAQHMHAIALNSNTSSLHLHHPFIITTSFSFFYFVVRLLIYYNKIA